MTIRTKDRVFFVWLMGDDEGGGWFEWKNGMEMELSDERCLQTSEGFGGRKVRNVVLKRSISMLIIDILLLILFKLFI